MCGVFGYVGDQDPIEICCQGLELLEYRGYDSTGIGGVSHHGIAFCKKAGKLASLKQVLSLPKLSLAIAHTRWATHGAVNDQNAHPHLDSTSSFAIVHNGILENYAKLKLELQKEGVQFTSDTDTEIIVQMIAKQYQGNLIEALQKSLPFMQGNFSLLLIHKDHPDEIIAAANRCPLAIAIDEKKTQTMISSDPNTFFGANFQVLFLQDREIACVQRGKVAIYGKDLMKKEKTSSHIKGMQSLPSKEGYAHFMLKEIFEQSISIQRAFENRNFALPQHLFQNIRSISMLASGTSAHAGQIASLLFEELASIPSVCEIASEAPYRKFLFTPGTLVIAISQSGETADTLAAIEKAHQKGCKILAICNVENSTIAREADAALFLKAGPEISVCSTKAFTNQLVVLTQLALSLALQENTLEQKEVQAFYQALDQIPLHIQMILKEAPRIEAIAKKYASYNNFFFMGRRYMYPTCLEAALKLKEISYANANGYPTGELKHGHIALLDKDFPVIAFCADSVTEHKTLSNLTEVKARGAPVLAIAPDTFKAVSSVADDVLWVPSTLDPLAPIGSSIVGQLLAYYIAKKKGCDIDQPRNLAKSVTVE